MGRRGYRRNRKGQFASSGTAVTMTYGRAGGFANAAHRSAVQGQRVRRARRRRVLRVAARAAGTAAAVGLTVAVRGQIQKSTINRIADVINNHP